MESMLAFESYFHDEASQSVLIIRRSIFGVICSPGRTYDGSQCHDSRRQVQQIPAGNVVVSLAHQFDTVLSCCPDRNALQVVLFFLCAHARYF